MPDLKDSHNQGIEANILKKFSFQDKIVIVTGGAGILGKVFAQGFLEFGGKVVLLDLNHQTLEETKNSLAKDPEVSERILTFPCDLKEKQEVEGVFGKIISHWGKIDVLVNGAAAKSDNFFEAIEDYYLEDWHSVIESNLTSMFLCSQNALKVMQQQKSGSIINIGSIYGVVGPDSRIYEGSEYMGKAINTPVTYAVTKGAVASFTRYLAVTQAEYGIRANAVSPGGVFSGQNDTFVEKYSSRTPMGRMADREEIANAVVFLASDAASYITGQNLIVDGGWTAW